MGGNIITFNGQEYDIVLTTKAVRDIVRKYGSLERIGEIFTSGDNVENDMFDAMVFLTYTLVNQSILRYNFENPTSKRPLLTEEEVDLFTDVNDLTSYLPVFTSVLSGDTSTKIKTEDSEKNVVPAL